MQDLIQHFGKGYWKTYEEGIQREWVVTNGLGGYCGSSIIDSPTRKHHGLLIASLHPPVRRYLILSRLQENITIGDNNYPLCTTKYNHRIIAGYKNLQRFSYDSFPIYTYQVANIHVTKEIIMEYGVNASVIRYTYRNGDKPSSLKIIPQFTYREHGESINYDNTNKGHLHDMNILRQEHSNANQPPLYLHQKDIENNTYILKANDEDTYVKYSYSQGKSNVYDQVKIESEIYLDTEVDTGMSGNDTNFSFFTHTLSFSPYEEKVLYVHCEVATELESFVSAHTKIRGKSFTTYCERQFKHYIQRHENLIKQSQIQSKLGKALVLASDQFIAYRQSTGLKTILAGLPWFSDWARDTMIALVGTTIATRQYETCREILLSFAKYEKNGIIPNMFPDQGNEPLYNTVDGPLWYFYAVYEYYLATEDKELVLTLYPVLKKIVSSFIQGTDFSIHMEEDGLIHAGSGLDQVTWMDVRVNDIVVTPRHGKPVEINALWYNGLMVMDFFSAVFDINDNSFSRLSEKVKRSFNQKFWNEKDQCLYDVVDKTDDDIRPNQIWAISLPFTMLPKDKELKVVNTVYRKLYTSYGLRSLSIDNKKYKGIYKGELMDRDLAYHQGTVWAFPLGGFITAYKKVYQDSSRLNKDIQSFLDPFSDHLRDGCIGSIAEIFDGDSPHISRGCYAQAWSVGEILRVIKELN